MKNIKYKLLNYLGLITLTIISYYKSLWYGFVFDDFPTIVDNVSIKTDSLSQIFLRDHRWLSYSINQITYKYFQLNPLPYRLTSLCIHLLTGLIILLITSKILQQPSLFKKEHFTIALLTSGLFLLHPISTQTATYITQARIEGLATLLIFISILFFINARLANSNFNKIIFYILTLITIILTTGAKETSLLIPVVILLIDLFFLKKETFKKRILIHLSILIILLSTHFFMGQIKHFFNIATFNIEAPNSHGAHITTTDDKIKPFQYFISEFKVMIHYITIFFWPNLSFDYDWKLAKNFIEVIPSLILLILLFLLAIFLLIKNKTNIVSFCILWFLLTLLPRTIVPSGELVFDYKTYLPSFGIFLLISISIIKLVQKFKLQKYYSYIIWSIFICLSILTLHRNKVWSSRLTLWEDVIKQYPNKHRALTNYATALFEFGQYQKAIDLEKRIIEANPQYIEPYINMAHHYQIIDNNDEASKIYTKIFQMKSVPKEAYNNLASLYFSQQKYNDAEKFFKLALLIDPNYSNAHFNLGRVYQLQNKFKEALTSYETARKYMIENIKLNYIYGEVCLQLGLYDNAIMSLEKVYRENKDFLNTIFYLGCSNYLKNNFKKSTQLFKLAYAKNPNMLFAFNLAQSLRNEQKYNEAQPLYELSKSITNFPYAYIHNAVCLKEIGYKDKAKSELDYFIKMSQNNELKQEAKELLKKLC